MLTGFIRNVQEMVDILWLSFDIYWRKRERQDGKRKDRRERKKRRTDRHRQQTDLEMVLTPPLPRKIKIQCRMPQHLVNSLWVLSQYCELPRMWERSVRKERHNEKRIEKEKGDERGKTNGQTDRRIESENGRWWRF